MDDFDSLFESLDGCDSGQNPIGPEDATVRHAPTQVPSRPALPLLPVRGLELQGEYARIRLVSPLGSGGMATVWRGELVAEFMDTEGIKGHDGHPIPNDLAIKFVNSASSQRIDSGTLTRRELAPLLALQGDRVVPVVDWCLGAPLTFLAFPYMSHGSLEDSIRESGPLSEEDLLRLAEHLFVAVGNAHRSCLLHLDIKPANILLDGQGGFLLADFGIAMEVMEGEAQKYPGIGTRAYHAPEQARSLVQAFDQRTDLFGVGMTLYAAAVGDTFRELFNQRQTCLDGEFAMPSLNDRRSDLRRELCAMIMGLIRNSQKDRPGSASEIRELVRAMIHGDRPAIQSSEEFAARRVDSAQTQLILSGLVSSSWRQLLTDRPHGGVALLYRSGEILIQQGEGTFSAYVLLAGELEVVYRGEIVGRIRREGEIVGEVSAFTGTNRSATVRATRDTYVLGFNAAEFESFVVSNPMVATRLLRSLCERYLSARDGQRRSEVVSWTEPPNGPAVGT